MVYIYVKFADLMSSYMLVNLTVPNVMIALSYIGRYECPMHTSTNRVHQGYIHTHSCSIRYPIYGFANYNDPSIIALLHVYVVDCIISIYNKAYSIAEASNRNLKAN